MKLYFSCLAICILMYLLGAFVACDFDIRNWDELGRVVIATLFLVAVIVSIMFNFLKEREEN